LLSVIRLGVITLIVILIIDVSFCLVSLF